MTEAPATEAPPVSRTRSLAAPVSAAPVRPVQRPAQPVGPVGPVNRPGAGIGSPKSPVPVDGSGDQRRRADGVAGPAGGTITEPETSPAKPRTLPKPGSGKTRRPARTGPKPGKQASRSDGKLTKKVVRVPRAILIVSGVLVIAVLAAAGYLLLPQKQAHIVAVPAKIGQFVKSPSVDKSAAQALRSKIVAGAAGEVDKVVAAVYEQTTGPGTSQGPQIIVFIGGNLTGGGSAGDFINGFMTQLHGSFTTSPGRLGGQAACAPGIHGGPAECAWADDDTFGVIVSATSGPSTLAAEMRLMRPLVEHPVK